MYFLAKQTPWGVAGYGTDLTAEQWKEYFGYGANQLTYYINAAGGYSLPLDGQFTAEKLAALFSIIEGGLPSGKTLKTATFEDIMVAMGFSDPDLVEVLQGILVPLLQDETVMAYAEQTKNMYIPGMPPTPTTKPWWHWALIVGGSVLGGGLVGGLIGYFAGKKR